MMAVALQETPSAGRIHIGFYGRRNSGKSSLINAFAGQEVSIVSQEPGTTTDPVNKPMEIHGLGACVLIDTAGFDDTGQLGGQRVERTKKAGERTDIAVLLCSDIRLDMEEEWYRFFEERRTPVIPVVSRADTSENVGALSDAVERRFGISPVVVSAKARTGLEELKERILRALPGDGQQGSITGSLARQGDIVLLVMPQDAQAPKGRLILPQVQTIRELLDKKCIVISVVPDQLEAALAVMGEPPKLIITDSQVFETVYRQKPQESMLTSFSVLFAAYKGDIDYYVESAAHIADLTETSRVLIAECCTHAPLSEDIGRVKLPRMLRKRYGETLEVTVVSGTDFPEDVTGYDLIIQCGGCMFNRKYVLSRVNAAKRQGVPMTNYGVAVAWLTGILDKVYVVKQGDLWRKERNGK